MRHLNKGRKFGRKRGPRALFRAALVSNLIRHGKITTTEARAKEIRPLVERLVSYGKRQNVAALRMLMQKLPKEVAYKLYHEVAPRYARRAGGYTRIVKRARARQHDAARMAVIEFV
ncbi:MAG: 50S ribosomal protein L17 [Patescibacteria group bacterium]